MAKIRIFSTQSNTLKTVEVDASNWGQLYDALTSGRYTAESGGNSPYDLSNCACKVKETRMAFDNSQTGRAASLPVGEADEVDFTLYIVPSKIKSGISLTTNEDLMNELHTVRQDLQEIKEAFASFMRQLRAEADDCLKQKKAYSAKEEAEAKLKAELAADAASFM